MIMVNAVADLFSWIASDRSAQIALAVALVGLVVFAGLVRAVLQAQDAAAVNDPDGPAATKPDDADRVQALEDQNRRLVNAIVALENERQVWRDTALAFAETVGRAGEAELRGPNFLLQRLRQLGPPVDLGGVAGSPGPIDAGDQAKVAQSPGPVRSWLNGMADRLFPLRPNRAPVAGPRIESDVNHPPQVGGPTEPLVAEPHVAEPLVVDPPPCAALEPAKHAATAEPAAAADPPESPSVDPGRASGEGPMLERTLAADDIVKSTVIAAMASGLVPVPVFDIAAVAALQTRMVQRLSAVYGVPFRANLAKSLVFALLSGVAPVMAAGSLVSVIKVIPGAGSLAGGAGVSVLAGAVTWAVGRVFQSHFESGGTLLDFSPSGMRARFRLAFREARLRLAR